MQPKILLSACMLAFLPMLSFAQDNNPFLSPNPAPVTPQVESKRPEGVPESVWRSWQAIQKERNAREQQALEKEAGLKQVTEIKDAAQQSAGLDDLLLLRKAQSQILREKMNSSTGSEMYSAAFLIGELHLTDEIPDLIQALDVVDLSARERTRERLRPWGQYPMAEALSKFGREATPDILSYLADTDDEPRKYDLALGVLVKTEGVKMAPLVVSDRASSEKDPAKKARLEAVAQELQKRADAADAQADAG